jgi:hypothetical protein
MHYFFQRATGSVIAAVVHLLLTGDVLLVDEGSLSWVLHLGQRLER